MNICVVGLGKIGLPIALQYASQGHQVIGADIDPRVVDRVLAGEVAEDEEPGSRERLDDALARGRITATADTAAAVAAAEAVVIVVPLIVDDQAAPDYGIIDSATADVARGLTSGTLVTYETTLPVRTTRTRLAPALAAGSGLTLGENLFVCHSPERVYTGRVYSDLRRYPKLVGGVNEQSAERGVAFYESVLEFDDRPDLPRPNGVWNVGSSDAAEFIKLAETTYRDVNIALANQFAMHADELNIDVDLIIDAANSQPFSHIHRPGVAVGGHCIPVYPRLYMSTDRNAEVVAAARATNEAMPAYAVDRLAATLGSLDGLTIAVLGAAYRGGVKETAFSGVFPLVQQLTQRGAIAPVHDPLFSTDELAALGLDAYVLGRRCDAAIIQADHDDYARLTPGDLPGARAVLDGRGIMHLDPWVAADIPVVRLGRP